MISLRSNRNEQQVSSKETHKLSSKTETKRMKSKLRTSRPTTSPSSSSAKARRSKKLGDVRHFFHFLDLFTERVAVIIANVSPESIIESEISQECVQDSPLYDRYLDNMDYMKSYRASCRHDDDAEFISRERNVKADLDALDSDIGI